MSDPFRPAPIRPVDAARILMRAAAVDNRDPSAAADEVWSDVLTTAGVRYDDCLKAVAIHFGRTTERLMPGHVIAIARELAAERAAHQRTREALALADGPHTDPVQVRALLDDLRARTTARHRVWGHRPVGVPGCLCHRDAAAPDPQCPVHPGRPA